MIYDILEKKLTDAGIAVPGVTLFRNRMPGEVDVGVMTRDPLMGIGIDPFIEGWYKPNLQVIVRHTDPVAGKLLADQVIKCLIVETIERYPANAERGACHLNLFYPRQEPIQFPRGEGNAIEWSLNFTTAFGVQPSWRA